MMAAPDPFDRLHDALVASAGERPGFAARPRRRPARRVATLAIVGVLVGGTAVAATTPWSPQLGGDHGLEPTTRTSRPLPRAQLAALGVLRRPQSDADQTAAVEKSLRRLGRFGTGVYVDGIRKLRNHPDGTVLLVPFRRVGPKNLPGVSRIHNALCLFRTSEGISVASSSCGTVADLERGRIRTTTDGLVPDGVQRVRVTLTTGQTLTADVADNYYELPYEIPDGVLPGNGVSRAASQAAGRRQLAAFRRINGRPIRWLDAQGAIVPKKHR